MSRRLEPKCKQCRRESAKLNLKGEKCLTSKCPMIKRAFRPGVHGPTSRVRPTPYGIQLREKQKAKETYGLQEKQFFGYFQKAKRTVGNTTDRMVQLLETRLDNVVYRLGFAQSRALCRQLANHGHVQVNGRRVTIPSYQVKPGDIITLAPKTAKGKLMANSQARIEKHQAPAWLLLDPAKLTGKVLNRPEGEDLKQNFDPTLIVEFYSR